MISPRDTFLSWVVLTDAFGYQTMPTPLSVRQTCPLAESLKSETPVALVGGNRADPSASQFDGAIQDAEKVRAEDCWRGEGVDSMK